MALEDVLCCLAFSKVLALLVVRSCASNALLVTFSTGSLAVACRAGRRFVPLTVGIALFPLCFIIIELLLVLCLGVSFA